MKTAIRVFLVFLCFGLVLPSLVLAHTRWPERESPRNTTLAIDDSGVRFSSGSPHCPLLRDFALVELPKPSEAAQLAYLNANRQFENKEFEAAGASMLNATYSLKHSAPLEQAELFFIQWMRLNLMQKAALSVAADAIERLESDGKIAASIDVRFEVASIQAINHSQFSTTSKKTISLITDLLQTRGAEIEPKKRAELWTRAGDWMIAMHKKKAALNAYQNAWRYYMESGLNPADLFSVPKNLCNATMFREVFAKTIDPTAEELVYVFEATVRSNGHVSHLTLIENKHRQRELTAVKSSGRFIHFRPAMADGQAIDTPRHRFRQTLFKRDK